MPSIPSRLTIAYILYFGKLHPVAMFESTGMYHAIELLRLQDVRIYEILQEFSISRAKGRSELGVRRA